MSFGFAVGDFIAVGTLIANIVDSLRGTKSDYQELLRELENLKRALEQVDKLGARNDRALAVGQIKSAALTCRYPLEDFLATIRKYERSLDLGKTSGVIKDTGKKIEWAFARKDEVTKLRNYLNIHIGTINMLMIRQGLEVLDLVSQQADRNQEDLQRCVESCSSAVKDVRGDIAAQHREIEDYYASMVKMFYMVCREIVAPLTVLNEMVSRVCVSTQEIYTIVLELRANNSGVDTRYTFFQTPVRVEDALGHVFPFPSECSIRALHAEIEARCNEGPVKNSVAAGDYAIVNPEDSDQVLDIRSCASPLPGMSLSMAIDLQSFFQLDCRQLQLGDCNIVVRVNSSRNAWTLKLDFMLKFSIATSSRLNER